jgi:hypothetical protein
MLNATRPRVINEIPELEAHSYPNSFACLDNRVHENRKLLVLGEGFEGLFPHVDEGPNDPEVPLPDVVVGLHSPQLAVIENRGQEALGEVVQVLPDREDVVIVALGEAVELGPGRLLAEARAGPGGSRRDWRGWRGRRLLTSGRLLAAVLVLALLAAVLLAALVELLAQVWHFQGLEVGRAVVGALLGPGPHTLDTRYADLKVDALGPRVESVLPEGVEERERAPAPGRQAEEYPVVVLDHLELLHGLDRRLPDILRGAVPLGTGRLLIPGRRALTSARRLLRGREEDLVVLGEVVVGRGSPLLAETRGVRVAEARPPAAAAVRLGAVAAAQVADGAADGAVDRAVAVVEGEIDAAVLGADRVHGRVDLGQGLVGLAVLALVLLVGVVAVGGLRCVGDAPGRLLARARLHHVDHRLVRGALRGHFAVVLRQLADLARWHRGARPRGALAREDHAATLRRRDATGVRLLVRRVSESGGGSINLLALGPRGKEPPVIPSKYVSPTLRLAIAVIGNIKSPKLLGTIRSSPFDHRECGGEGGAHQLNGPWPGNCGR